jgi:hypothetical protein
MSANRCCRPAWIESDDFLTIEALTDHSCVGYERGAWLLPGDVATANHDPVKAARVREWGD